MKTFICNHCGNQVQRPTAPMRCDRCGQARVGLFKAAPAGQAAPQPAAPGHALHAPPVPGAAPPGAPAMAAQHGGFAPVMPAPPPPPGAPGSKAPGIAPPPPPGKVAGGFPAPSAPAAGFAPPQPMQPAAPARPAGGSLPSAPPPPSFGSSPAPYQPAPAAPTAGGPPGVAAFAETLPHVAPQPASQTIAPPPAAAPPKRAAEAPDAGSPRSGLAESAAPPRKEPARQTPSDSRPPPTSPASGYAMPPPGRSNTAQPPGEAPPRKAKPHKPAEKTTSTRSTEQTVDQRPAQRAPAREDSRRAAEPPQSTPPQAKREEPSRQQRAHEERSRRTGSGSADSGSLRSAQAEVRAVPGSSTPGTVVWTYPRLIPGQNLDLGAQRGCVAIDGNRQMLLALGKKLVALTEHEEGPRELWDYPTRGYIPGSPTVGRDGNIRVHSGDGMLHCVSGSGEQAFPPVKVGEPLGWAAPLVDDDNNTFICAYNGGLIKIDSRGSRATQPFFRSRQKFDSTGVIHRGVLYVGAEDAFVYAIRLAASQGRNEWNHAKDHGKTEWFINTAIAYHDGLFIVAGRDEYLYAFNEEGLAIWKLHLRGQMLGSPVIDQCGNIYVGVSLEQRGEESSGKLVCVSASSHDVRWEYAAAGAIESTPVIGDDDVLYFGDNEGVVHAVDLNGRGKWTQKVGSAVRSGGTITPAKRVIFGTDRGDIVALACSSNGLAKQGWPKFLGTAGQSGLTHARR